MGGAGTTSAETRCAAAPSCSNEVRVYPITAAGWGSGGKTTASAVGLEQATLTCLPLWREEFLQTAGHPTLGFSMLCAAQMGLLTAGLSSECIVYILRYNFVSFCLPLGAAHTSLSPILLPRRTGKEPENILVDQKIYLVI